MFYNLGTIRGGAATKFRPRDWNFEGLWPHHIYKQTFFCVYSEILFIIFYIHNNEKWPMTQYYILWVILIEYRQNVLLVNNYYNSVIQLDIAILVAALQILYNFQRASMHHNSNYFLVIRSAGFQSKPPKSREFCYKNKQLTSRYCFDFYRYLYSIYMYYIF